VIAKIYQQLTENCINSEESYDQPGIQYHKHSFTQNFSSHKHTQYFTQEQERKENVFPDAAADPH